jgi:hypothetical protein
MANLQELKKLKELLDAGVLTQEEFDTQKKVLLSEEQPKTSDTPQMSQANTYIPQQSGQYVPPQNQQVSNNTVPAKKQEKFGAKHVILIIVIVIIGVAVVSRANNRVPEYNRYTTPPATVAITENLPIESTTTSLPQQTTTQAETTETQTETTKSNFKPKDVFDATIKSIVTYNDYLTMYGMIIDDYLDNYQSLFKGTMLYDQATFDDMKKQYASALEEQKEQYGAMGNSPIVGKDTLVDFLITYRDTLNEYVESMRPLISMYS